MRRFSPWLVVVLASLLPEVAAAQPAKPSGSVAQRYPKRSTTIVGDTTTLAVQVDGKPVLVPSLRLELGVPAGLELGRSGGVVNLSAPGRSGWAGDKLTFRAALDGPAPLEWSLIVSRVDQGLLVPTQSVHGSGAPGEIGWDGLGQDGKPIPAGSVLVAQLRVRLAGDVELTSPRLVFAVGVGGAQAEVVRGELFAGPQARPVAGPALARQAAALAKRFAGSTLEVEVHADGSGDKLERLAETQKQGEVFKQALVAAGVPAERIKVRGRGSLDPLSPAKGAAARRQNRRVVVKPSAASGPGLAAPPALVADALIAGQPATIEPGGRFVKNVATPADGRILVDVLAADGRRVSFWLAVRAADGPTRKAAARPATRVLAGDVGAGTLSLDGRPLDTALLGLDVGLEGQDSFRLLPAQKARRRKGQLVPAAPARVDRPIVFTTSMPVDLAVARWRIQILGGAGTPVHALSGEGKPPASVAWNGADEGGKPLLARGQRYRYRLVVETARGDRGESSERGFAVGPVPAAAASVSLTGASFTGKGEPGARLKDALARLVTRAKTRKDEVYRVDIVVVAGASATDARLGAATRAARVRAYLGKLGAPMERVEVRAGVLGAEVPRAEQKERVSLGPVVGSGPARAVVLGAPVSLDGSRFSVDVLLPSGAAVPVEMVRASGQRAVWIVAAGAASRARAAWDDDNLAAPDWNAELAVAGDPGEEGLLPMQLHAVMTVEPTGDEGLMPASGRDPAAIAVEPTGEEGLLPVEDGAPARTVEPTGEEGLLPPSGSAAPGSGSGGVDNDESLLPPA